MRETYIHIIKMFADRAEVGTDTERRDIAQLVVTLNDEDAPFVGQDVTDFLCEFYAFVLFGHNPERKDEGNAIKDWADLRDRLHQLELAESSQLH